MRILGYILIWGAIVLVAFGLTSPIFATSYIMLEDFEGFTAVDQELPDLITDNDWGGPLDGKHWRSDADSYEGSWALEDLWASSGTYEAKWTFDNPITTDGTFSLQFKPTDSGIDFYMMFWSPSTSINIDFIRNEDWIAWEWNKLSIEMDFQVDPVKVHLSYYLNDIPLFDQIFDNVSELVAFSISRQGGTASFMNIDNVGLEGEPETASINIVSPLAGTEQEDTFDLIGNYDKKGEDWDRIAVWFEEWDPLSTCPLFGTPEWYIEDDLGWFHFGSLEYGTGDLLSPIGDFSISIQGLISGNFNCIKCYFFNTDLQLYSPSKCQGYNLIVGGGTPYVPPVPFSTWADYYFSVSEKFPTSTPLFNSITGSFSPIIDKMVNFSLFVKEYFDVEEATSRGEDLGGAIPKARGYLEMIDDFIGLPLSGFIIFYILTMAVVISYKIILAIIKLLKP